MEVPSLAKLALSSLVCGIHQGYYDDLDYSLNSDLSNKVVSGLLENSDFNKSMKMFEGKLNPTKIDFSEFRLDQENCEFVKMQNLESLACNVPKDDSDVLSAFDMARFLRSMLNSGEYSEAYDIVRLLKSMLNEESKNRLGSLTIYSSRILQIGWTAEVGKMLPSLQYLNLSDLKDFKDFEFQLLCQFFPNLKSLDISYTDVTTLNGISRLEYLEILNLQGLKLGTSESLMDIFECLNLRVLDLSFVAEPEKDSYVMENYLKCGKILEEVRFLDCTSTDIDERMLRELMITHRKLEQVVVINTLLEDISISGITLLNVATHSSTIQSLRYFISSKNKIISWILNTIAFKIYHGEIEYPDQETSMEYIKVCCEALKVFKTSEDVYRNVLNCIVINTQDDILNVMNPNLFSTLISLLIEKNQKYLNSSKEEMIQCHRFTWSILGNPNILENPVLSVGKLWNHAIDCIQKLKQHSLMQSLGREFSVMLKLFSRLSYMEKVEILKDGEVLDIVISFLKTASLIYEMIPDVLDEISISFDIIFESLKYEKCRKMVANMGYGGWGCADILMSFLHRIENNTHRQQVTLKVFKILAILIEFDELKSSCVKFLNDRAKFFISMLNKTLDLFDPNTGTYLNTDIAYYSMTILALLVKKKDNRDTLEMMHFCKKIDSRLVSVEIDFPEISSILKKILRGSKQPGSIAWALLTVKITLERDLKIEKKLREFGLIEDIEKLHSDEKTIMGLKEKILNLVNFKFLKFFENSCAL